MATKNGDRRGRRHGRPPPAPRAPAHSTRPTSRSPGARPPPRWGGMGHRPPPWRHQGTFPHPPPPPTARKRTDTVAGSPSKRKVPTAWQSQVVAAAMARRVVVRSPKGGTIAAGRAAASGRVAAASPRGRASRGPRSTVSVTTAGTQVRGTRLPPPAPMPPPHRQRCAASSPHFDSTVHGEKSPWTRGLPSTAAAANTNDGRAGAARSWCVRRPRPRPRWPPRPSLRRRREASGPCPRRRCRTRRTWRPVSWRQLTTRRQRRRRRPHGSSPAAWRWPPIGRLAVG